MLKIGVFGAGHLGKIHMKLLKASEKFKLIGFYDPDKISLEKLNEEGNYKYFNSPIELINEVDVIDIVTPTNSHLEMAMMAIDNKKHVFIEKPISYLVEDANKIINNAKKNKVLGQVGHVERFNPAFKAVKKIIANPMFIECHRLSEFNPRGTDVSVVLDLMIHDIDIILSLDKSKIKSIEASGVSVVSKSPDICNARILFESGCVANLTSSRISLKKMRKARFFQKDTYISIDYLFKKVEVVKIKDSSKASNDLPLVIQNAEGEKKQIFFENPSVIESNAILEELESFADSINNNIPPTISLEDGRNALKIANKIISKINL
tara:strand:+ start:1079 stop:2044 length:966 start_codon:yes stop_codon:yes gene_type:complete